MSELTYKVSARLPALAVGDEVECLDRNFQSMGIQKISKVAKRYVQTECGRQWTTDYGEWIASFHGNKPESYPFPSIRKVAP